MKKKHLRVLEMITQGVPKELSEKLMKKDYIAPVAREAILRGLKDPQFDKEFKKKLQVKLDSGFFDQMVDVVDTEIEAKIEEYYTKEIEKAVKLGLLPKKDKSILKKIKKYGKKRNASNGDRELKETNDGASTPS